MYRLFFGAGGVGLHSLATGLPAGFLLNPALGRAQTAAPPTAQFLLMATSGAGEPLNPYVPGSYVDGVVHSTDARLAATPLTLGGQPFIAGAHWAALPQPMLDRSAFFHFSTGTIVHSDEQNVLALMGAMRRGQMTVGTFGNSVAGDLGTTSVDAISFNESLVSAGRSIAPLSAASMGAILADAPGPLADLQKIRDQGLDSINAVLKKYGTSAERKYLDTYALSQQNVRNLSLDLLQSFTSISDNSFESQLQAACLLFKMKAVPAINVSMPFGGDNHSDPGLLAESTANVTSLASLAKLWTTLNSLGLQDQVLFATLSVFGRTLEAGAENGRSHNGYHQVGYLMGSRVRPGVVGGIVKDTNNFFHASGINSATGAADDGGDIPRTDTLASYGQTIAALMGVPAATYATIFTAGKVVAGVIK